MNAHSESGRNLSHQAAARTSNLLLKLRELSAGCDRSRSRTKIDPRSIPSQSAAARPAATVDAGLLAPPKNRHLARIAAQGNRLLTSRFFPLRASAGAPHGCR